MISMLIMPWWQLQFNVVVSTWLHERVCSVKVTLFTALSGLTLLVRKPVKADRDEQRGRSLQHSISAAAMLMTSSLIAFTMRMRTFPEDNWPCWSAPLRLYLNWISIVMIKSQSHKETHTHTHTHNINNDTHTHTHNINNDTHIHTYTHTHNSITRQCTCMTSVGSICQGSRACLGEVHYWQLDQSPAVMTLSQSRPELNLTELGWLTWMWTCLKKASKASLTLLPVFALTS